MKDGLTSLLMRRKGLMVGIRMRNEPARLQWSTALHTSPCTASRISAPEPCCTPERVILSENCFWKELVYSNKNQDEIITCSLTVEHCCSLTVLQT